MRRAGLHRKIQTHAAASTARRGGSVCVKIRVVIVQCCRNKLPVQWNRPCFMHSAWILGATSGSWRAVVPRDAQASRADC